MLLQAIASPAYLLRGYLIMSQNEKEAAPDAEAAEEGEGEAETAATGKAKRGKKAQAKKSSNGSMILKRKSPLIVLDAEQVSSGQSQFEVGSTSGERTSASFRYKEMIGEIVYLFHAALDYKEMQFVPTDDSSGRRAVRQDDLDRYMDILCRRFGLKDAKELGSVGYYGLSTAVNGTKEHGLLLDPAILAKLTAEYLKRLLTLNITRATGHAGITEVSYKHIYNPLQDSPYRADGWTEIDMSAINNVEEINASSINLAPENIEVFYAATK